MLSFSRAVLQSATLLFVFSMLTFVPAESRAEEFPVNVVKINFSEPGYVEFGDCEYSSFLPLYEDVRSFSSMEEYFEFLHDRFNSWRKIMRMAKAIRSVL